MTRMPTIFFGHGSPMIALEENAVTQTWVDMVSAFAKPKAILMISAHWQTRGTAVTAMDQPRTIHDFGAFPQALFDVRYPAPGAPDIAARVRDVLSPLPVAMDRDWGFDHGTWSVLKHAYPQADVPVVQLSMDATKPAAHHFAIGQRIRALRDEGVLIAGTGNIVHNLSVMDWNRPQSAYDWATRFNDYIRDAIADDQPERVVDYQSRGTDARMAVPSPDHFWPLLYVLGARHEGEVARFDPDFIEYGSLGMTSVAFG